MNVHIMIERLEISHKIGTSFLSFLAKAVESEKNGH